MMKNVLLTITNRLKRNEAQKNDTPFLEKNLENANVTRIVSKLIESDCKIKTASSTMHPLVLFRVSVNSAFCQCLIFSQNEVILSLYFCIFY